MAKKETKAQPETTNVGVPIVQEDYEIGQVLGTVDVIITNANSLGQYHVEMAVGDGESMYCGGWKDLEQVEKIRNIIDPEFRKKKLLEKKAEIEKQLEELDK